MNAVLMKRHQGECGRAEETTEESANGGDTWGEGEGG